MDELTVEYKNKINKLTEKYNKIISKYPNNLNKLNSEIPKTSQDLEKLLSDALINLDKLNSKIPKTSHKLNNLPHNLNKKILCDLCKSVAMNYNYSDKSHYCNHCGNKIFVCDELFENKNDEIDKLKLQKMTFTFDDYYKLKNGKKLTHVHRNIENKFKRKLFKKNKLFHDYIFI